MPSLPLAGLRDIRMEELVLPLTNINSNNLESWFCTSAGQQSRAGSGGTHEGEQTRGHESRRTVPSPTLCYTGGVGSGSDRELVLVVLIRESW